jgi:hypothetical protein
MQLDANFSESAEISVTHDRKRVNRPQNISNFYKSFFASIVRIQIDKNLINAHIDVRKLLLVIVFNTE